MYYDPWYHARQNRMTLMGFLAQHMPTDVDRSMDANNSQKKYLFKQNVLPPFYSMPGKIEWHWCFFLAQLMPTCVDRSMDAYYNQKNVFVQKNVLPPLISSPAKQKDTDGVFGTARTFTGQWMQITAKKMFLSKKIYYHLWYHAQQNRMTLMGFLAQLMPTEVDRSMPAHDKTTNQPVLILIMMIMTETT